MSTTTAPAQPDATMQSPRDVKKSLPKEEPQTESKPTQPSQDAKKAAEPRAEESSAAAPSTKVDDATVDNKSTTNAAQPLAPPPKPNQKQDQSGDNPGPDYFSGNHSTTHFLEPNPFEQSFGNPSTETPGRFAGLPPVASLTSPAPIGPGVTPGWQLGSSLRSGPLSPAMLTGPANPTSYFDDQFRQSFPTPNESSLRTGLTPGGGGSMFPAPSPSSQALFNSMSGGLATPGTLDFHRSALTAATRSKVDTNNNGTGNGNINQAQGPQPASQPVQSVAPKQEFPQPPPPQQHMNSQDPFGNHPDRDAVNSLYMLAQTGTRNANQFAVPAPPHQMNTNMSQQARMGPPSQDTSPINQRGRHSNAGTDGSFEDEMENDKSGGKGRGKKNSIGKGSGTTNGRRKAEDTPSKAPASKRAKSNMGPPPDDFDMMEDDEDDDIKEESDIGPNGKKMTDEEKRKNFLERNRIAALKCRQRKKQWLANLQAKVEIFTSENDALNAQNAQLRDEIMNLKTLLLAHRDCPVSHQQGLAGNTMNQVIGADFSAQPNPYGMGMPQNGGPMQGQPVQMHAGPGMQRS